MPVVAVPTAHDKGALGEEVGRACAGGDVLVLTGDLGAGKTTFTQGLARGLGVTEQVTSPTFVIARVHPNESDGPALAHVDAYRLSSGLELDDLDLDTDLAGSVVVVEWGGGMAERLSPVRLGITIRRSDDEADEVRSVEFEPTGDRWLGPVDAIVEGWSA